MGLSVNGITSAEVASATGITIPLPVTTAGFDVAYAMIANRSTVNQTFTEGSATWTKLADLYANATRDVNFALFRKVMGAVPDFSVNMDCAVALPQLAMTWSMHEEDQVTPEDTAAQTFTGTATGNINPPAIVPVTNGAWVIACGGSSIVVAGVTITEPPEYTNIGKVTHTTTDIILAASYKIMSPPVSENPGAYSISGSSANDSYCAVSLAVRPQFPLVDTLPQRQKIVGVNRLTMR